MFLSSSSVLTWLVGLVLQYHNPATLNIATGTEESVPVKGWLFNEATFVSP